jgi:ubiquinone/menaquinone biosynthesis C-methylase UbiE
MRKEVSEVENELSRLEAEYRYRDSSAILAERYSLFNQSAHFHLQSLERNLLALLKQHSFTHLAEKKILDVGCGSGMQLRRFLEYGALPENLSGIDLMPHRIKEAQRLIPLLIGRWGVLTNCPGQTQALIW